MKFFMQFNITWILLSQVDINWRLYILLRCCCWNVAACTSPKIYTLQIIFVTSEMNVSTPVMMYALHDKNTNEVLFQFLRVIPVQFADLSSIILTIEVNSDFRWTVSASTIVSLWLTMKSI